ncbi:MAG: nickel/cobalt efflux transporter RcnA [Proteobacteria bacterium]|nr:nickel/cobalt efflux transporter RcnA [Pseudomonadota bacterium]
MTPFAELLSQGAAHAWLFIPSAILLGALHGLEPGHSKTMMAAFIVAIRGTVGQAVLLGLMATVSHTFIVWVIALGGMYLWRGIDAATLEPYLQLVSALIILGVSAWMFVRTWRDHQRARLVDHHHDHQHGHGRHDHGHHHHHDSDQRMIDTGHGLLGVEIFETGVPPRWRVMALKGHGWSAADVSLEIERPDGRIEGFSFTDRGGYLESVEEIAEPHEFMARLKLSHGHHSHDYDLAFIEQDQGHDHMHEELRGLDVSTGGYRDAHELAHANDIRRRFADRNVTNGQIVLFGLTGGLIPCPAAITVLLLCLQLKEIPLGAALVLCFSIGLAVTLVAVGAVAALSVHHATKHWQGFGNIVRRAPYVSSLLIALVGLYVGIQGWLTLSAS